MPLPRAEAHAYQLCWPARSLCEQAQRQAICARGRSALRHHVAPTATLGFLPHAPLCAENRI